jgi:hypothetical protein
MKIFKCKKCSSNLFRIYLFTRKKRRNRKKKPKEINIFLYRQLKLSWVGYEYVRVISSFFFRCISIGKQFQKRIVSSADKLTIGLPLGHMIKNKIHDVWPHK